MIKFLSILLALGVGAAPCLAAEGAADVANGVANIAADGPSTGINPAVSERQVLVMLHLPAPHFRPDATYSGRYTDDAGHSARRRIAEDLARAHGLKLVTDWPMPALGVDCYVMEQPANVPSSRIVELLSKDPRVEWAQPMSMFHGLGHSDPLYPVQPGAKYWHLAEIHKVATGRKVRVAVVDSGVEEQHPDLNGQLDFKENFVDGNPYAAETHGTAVAGIIAAHAGNGVGIEGVAPDARLMALRACWQGVGRDGGQDTQCSSFTLGKALNFAITHDAQVINMSLSGPPDRLLERLLDVALGHGIKLIGAVDPHSASGGFPASYPGVIAVADQPSTNPPGVLIAPGHDIPATAPGARWSLVSGSSYAAAHVSGMVALMTELRPRFTPVQIREAIALNPWQAVNSAASGTIDACATITLSTGTCPCSCTSAHVSKASNYR